MGPPTLAAPPRPTHKCHMRRRLSVLLSVSLVILSPGLSSYEILAQSVRAGSSARGGSSQTGTGTSGTRALGGGASRLAPMTFTAGGASLPGVAGPQGGAIPDLPLSQVEVFETLGAMAGPSEASDSRGDVASPLPGFSLAPSAGASEEQAKRPSNLVETQAAIESVSRAEPIRELENPKADKPALLRLFFDRFKAKPAAVREGGAAAVDQLPAQPLAKAQAELRPHGAVVAVPAPEAALARGPTAIYRAGLAKAGGIASRIRKTFDLSEFNASEKSYILGQAVFLFAISVYLASLPLLVKALTGDAAMTGVARAVHFWVFGGASLVAGSVVAATPMKRILVGAATTRGVLFGSIGLLALMGGLSWPVFLVLVGVNSLIVAHNHLVDIDTGGAAKVFSSDKKIEKAGYVYDFIFYGMMLVVPALLGLPMDWLDAAYGPGIGAAAGFTLFAGLMIGVASIYGKKVVILAEKAKGFGIRSWQGVRTFFKPMAVKAGSVLAAVGLAGIAASAAVALMPGVAAGVVLTVAGVLGIFHWETMKVMWGNKAILGRSVLATYENFIEDALFAVVLPTFAIDMLKAGAFGNGILLSAITLGGLLASTLLMSRAQAIQRKIGVYPFLVWLSIGASVAFIPSIGLWMFPSILLAIPAVMAMKFLYQPIRSRMRALLQSEIRSDPKAKPHSEKIFSLMTFTEVLAAGAGGLAFSWLFKNSGPGTAVFGLLGSMAAMKVVTIMLAGFSIVNLLVLPWLKTQLNKRTRTVHRSADGLEGKALEKLATNLKRMGLEAYTTQIEAGRQDSDRPTVAILAPASVYKLSIAREGARQSPGDVHLALDPSWLIQETGSDGKSALYLARGLTFDSAGRAVIRNYSQPRRVRYFANFYTQGANDRDDGVPLERNLDVPMSNSVQLEKITNDKLLTRLMLAARGVGVPATLAFLLAAHPHAARAGSLDAGAAVAAAGMPTGDAARGEIRGRIEAFLAAFKGEEVVIKPSGPQWHSGYGVKFFQRARIDEMVSHVLALSTHERMTPDGAVLVDARLSPPPLYLRTKGLANAETDAFLGDRVPLHVLEPGELSTASPKEKKDWNLRVLAARAPWGKGATTGIFARAGTWGLPTTAEPSDPEDAAAVVRLEDVIRALKAQHGLLKTPREEAEFRAALDDLGRRSLEVLAEKELARAREDGEPAQAQTDFIGLDVMVELEHGRLVPKVIEVNDHDAGGQWQLDEFYPNRAGEHSREWIATMLARARRDALKGKRIILVGAGYPGKRFFFEKAKELGIRITLVDKPESWAKDLVEEFIPVDTTAAETAVAAARKKIWRSARWRGSYDGITTFWEDDVVLTARLSQELGLKYHSLSSAEIARSKYLTRQATKDAGIPTPAFRTLNTAADLEKMLAEDGVPFPAILKPVRGAAAQSTVKVNNAAEARAAFARIARELETSDDPIFKQGREILFDEYLDGREWDVDVVLQGGRVVYRSITDNWPTREPTFLATGSSLPSRLLTAREQTESMDLAEAALAAAGFKDGVFHVEGKYTSRGARLIELNARPGGMYVVPWNKSVWGVDLTEMLFLTAAGIPAVPFKPSRPRTHLEGEFLIPTESGVLSAVDGAEAVAAMPGFRKLALAKAIGDRVSVPPNGYDRVGMLVAEGSNGDQARRNLEAMRSGLRVNILAKP